MTLDKVIDVLTEIRKKASGDTKVCFDTEAAKFNVHYVEIERIYHEPRMHTNDDGTKMQVSDEDLVICYDDHKNSVHIHE